MVLTEEQVKGIIQGMAASVLAPLIDAMKASQHSTKPKGTMLDTKAFSKMPTFTKGTSSWRKFQRKLKCIADVTYPQFGEGFLNQAENHELGTYVKRIIIPESPENPFNGLMCIVKRDGTFTAISTPTIEITSANIAGLTIAQRNEQTEYVHAFLADLDNVFVNLLDGGGRDHPLEHRPRLRVQHICQADAHE